MTRWSRPLAIPLRPQGAERGQAEPSSPRLLLKRREFVDEGSESQRGIELVAEIELVPVRPDLELLVERHRADLLHELVLRLLPERLLLDGIRLATRSVDLLVRHVAVREVGDRRWRADDAARVEELREVDVG